MDIVDTKCRTYRDFFHNCIVRKRNKTVTLWPVGIEEPENIPHPWRDYDIMITVLNFTLQRSNESRIRMGT